MLLANKSFNLSFIFIKSPFKVIKESLEYPDIKDFNFLLNLALKNGDYLTALRNVGKCIYYSPDSSILKIYRSLLYTISDLNKKNQQKEYILKVVIER